MKAWMCATGLLVVALHGGAAPPVQGLPAPQHGGVTARAQDLELELVATPTLVQLYLRKRQGPLDIAHTRARLTISSAADTQALDLRPAGDRLEATGQFALMPGTVLVATVAPAGAPVVTARFVIE
jgi:hypothetical protein